MVPTGLIFLINVADDELIASQTVKYIFLVVLVAGVAFNLYRLFRQASAVRKVISILVAAVLGGIALYVTRWIEIEGSLLNQPLYTEGVTTGFCEERLKGRAIEFQYEVDGATYTQCNTYHPVALENIQVPGGQYMVRYSAKYPALGRMNFRKPVEEQP